MVEFTYNNAKYGSIGYRPFKLNCGYHLCIFYKKNVDSHSRSKTANELTKKLRNLIAICIKNLQHTQELQKQAYNKGTKAKSYALGKKIWLDSKYIKTKCNQKLKVKFFGVFRVLYLVDSQAYKLELPKQWRIYNIFHMFLLEQNIIRKEQVDEKTAEQTEFKASGNNEEYKMEGICDSVVYARKSEVGYLSAFYYLIY